MKWDEIAQQQCSIARTSAVIGDRWTLIVLSDVFLGARRFEEFQERLGISRTTLAARLKLLETHGVLRREPYQERPVRWQYRLTGKGRDLYPVVSAILDWGDRYYAGEEGPPILRRHRTCGQPLEAKLVCAHCDGEVTASTVEAFARPEHAGVPPVERGPVLRDQPGASDSLAESS